MATRWGIASAGKISSDFVNAVRLLPASDHEVVAVAARKIEDAKAFADKFNIPAAYGSYEELAKDPNVDVVYVSTIHPHHARLNKMMLSGNKHVLSEKPFAMNTRQGAEVLQMAKEKKLFIMEGYWSRFFPVYQQLRQELKAKAIGEVRVVNVNFGFTSNPVDHQRLIQKELGGGAILDIGCYTVQFAQLVFGEKPEKITATGTLLPTGVDETCVMTLTYSGGRHAVLVCSVGAKLKNIALVQGTEGYIEIPNFFWSPTELIVNGKKTEFPLPKCAVELNFPHSEGFSYEAQHVRERLLQGDLESPLVTHANTLEISDIMDEARRQMGVVFDVDNV